MGSVKNIRCIKNMQTYVRELNKLYQAHPALYEQDFDTEGFEWNQLQLP
mgnify:CR=1 FL=1